MQSRIISCCLLPAGGSHLCNCHTGTGGGGGLSATALRSNPAAILTPPTPSHPTSSRYDQQTNTNQQTGRPTDQPVPVVTFQTVLDHPSPAEPDLIREKFRVQQSKALHNHSGRIGVIPVTEPLFHGIIAPGRMSGYVKLCLFLSAGQ